MNTLPTLRVLVVNEGVLGHTGVMGQLARKLGQRSDVNVSLVTVPPVGRISRRLLVRSRRLGELDLHLLRWRLRWSWEANRLLRDRASGADVALVNTQACASLSVGVMSRLPCVLSVDATVGQYVSLGYHRPQDRFTRVGAGLVARLETRALRAAAGVMPWTQWNRDALMAEHGLDSTRVTVLHPGVDVAWWRHPGARAPHEGPTRFLFVGNDVERKGLRLLTDAAATMGNAIVDVVTGDDVSTEGSVRVHRGVAPGSEELRRLYREADVFVLPSYADAVPNVVLEAMAAGLPVIASDVGAIPEIVGDAGVVVPRGDRKMLGAALSHLADDPQTRARLGERAYQRAREHYDAELAAERLAGWLRAVARPGGAVTAPRSDRLAARGERS
jgi:glycosyltransferase involved in cell wall biosynthesis